MAAIVINYLIIKILLAIILILINNIVNNTDNNSSQSGTRMNADIITINNETKVNPETKEEELIRRINNMKKKSPKKIINNINNNKMDKINNPQKEELLKIVFITSTGNKDEIMVFSNITVENLIKKYLEEIHLDENIVGENFFFLWNANKLNHKSIEIIGQKFKYSKEIIISVIDINNIINVMKY